MGAEKELEPTPCIFFEIKGKEWILYTRLNTTNGAGDQQTQGKTTDAAPTSIGRKKGMYNAFASNLLARPVYGPVVVGPRHSDHRMIRSKFDLLTYSKQKLDEQSKIFRVSLAELVAVWSQTDHSFSHRKQEDDKPRIADSCADTAEVVD